MSKVFVLLAAAVIASLHPHPVHSQTPQALECALCRALIRFDTCKGADIFRAPKQSIGIEGKVVSIGPQDCGARLVVDVYRASNTGFPKQIGIYLNECFSWNGSIGDEITAFVRERPSQQRSAYELITCPSKGDRNG